MKTLQATIRRRDSDAALSSAKTSSDTTASTSFERRGLEDRGLESRELEGRELNDWKDTPPLLVRLYRSRGAAGPAELNTDLAALLPPSLKGIALAADLLAEAIAQGQKILILGDFDADGATSVALGVLVLRAMGAEVDYLVPNRFEFGYGLSPEIVAVAAERQPDIILTVDNGIASHAGVAAANALGISVIITDHHLAGDSLPAAAAIVNPNQPGCDFPSKNLAGVGVLFYLLSVLRKTLLDRGWFADGTGRSEPRLADYLDLVALGTVADVVPLDSNNRILVAQGLRRLRAGRCRPGIAALLRMANREPARAVASDFGFAVGPRLNAAGRLDDMSLGIRCLLAESEAEAMALAAELDGLNRERREIEQGMREEAEAIVAEQLAATEGDNLPHSICLFDDSWHQGVVGIIASRIKERFHRPCIVFAEESESHIKGSGRSIPGVHMRDALDLVAKREPDVLQKFGGHAMAAGLSLAKQDLPRFMQCFEQVLQDTVAEELLSAELLSDGELDGESLNLSTAQMLREAGPWGQGFAAPLFDGEFEVLQQRLVGSKHLKLVVAPVAEPERSIDAIAFFVDTDTWPNHEVRRVHLAYSLDVNEFRGVQSPQLIVEQIQAL